MARTARIAIADAIANNNGQQQQLTSINAGQSASM
jgi:hypothetical protein